jgi:hypothetical protein
VCMSHCPGENPLVECCCERTVKEAEALERSVAERAPRSPGCRARAMITLFVLPLILSFAPVAVWAMRAGGLRRLWLLCALALLADLLAALVLSVVYAVPSVWRVVLLFLAFVGPSILFTAVSLTLGGFARILPLQLAVAFAGCLVGLAMGFVVAVYGPVVW